MGFGLTTEVDGFGRTTSNRPCVAPAAHALFFAGGFASMQNTSQKGCTPWRYQLTGKLRKATEKDQEYAAKVVDSKAAVLRDLLRNKEALCDALLRRS